MMNYKHENKSMAQEQSSIVEKEFTDEETTYEIKNSAFEKSNGNCTFFWNRFRIWLSTTDSDDLLKRYGYNTLSPPKKNLFKRVYTNFLTPYGYLLVVSVVSCILAWKPLGGPDPDTSNLILGCVLSAVFVVSRILKLMER